MLEKSEREWSGRRVVFPVHVRRAGVAVGARADGGTLPSAGNQAYQLSTISATYQYARIQVTGPTLASSKNAFADALDSELQAITDELRVDLGRQSWGEGFGVMARVGLSTSGSIVQVFNRFSAPGHPGGRYFEVGMEIEGGILTNGDSVFGSNSITDVAIATNPASTTDSITVSTTTGNLTSSADFLFREGNSLLEMMGARGIIDAVTAPNIYTSAVGFQSAIQGISRSDTDTWNATVLGNSQVERILDAYLMQQAFDNIHRASGQKPAFIVGEHRTVTALFDSVSADRRYMSSGFDAGMSSLTYNGVKVEVDRQAPYNELFLWAPGALQLYVLKDMGFADDDGSVLSRVANADQFEAYLRWYGNIGTEAPHKTCVIRDIKVDL